MAGSPEYIDLLADIGSQPPLYVIWDDLEDAWTRLTIEQSEQQLLHLADAAFSLLSHETNTPLERIMAEATELHIAKNAGYAGADNPDPWANFRLSEIFGISPFNGVLVRLSDKWSRIVSLRRNPSNERIGESLLDTLRDLAAYALIALCLLREQERAAA